MSLRSPREILLARERAAVPALDRARAAAVATVLPRAVSSSLLGTVWRELFLSWPKAWAGLATLWLLLAGLHLSNRSALSGVNAAPSISSDDLLAAWKMQRRVLAEISPVVETARPRSSAAPNSN